MNRYCIRLQTGLHSSCAIVLLKVLSECNGILGLFIVPCEGGSRAVKVETVTVRSEQAGRSHKKGRTDYRLKEGSPANLRVGIKYWGRLFCRQVKRQPANPHRTFRLSRAGSGSQFSA